MRLLLDSSGTGLLVALADAEGVILERFYESGSPESRDIGKSAGEVLGEISIPELEQVVVGLGPGTFIGTRIAISYANGLAAVSPSSLRGVDSLAAVTAVHGGNGTVAIRDARRKDVYLHNPREKDPHQQTRIVAIDQLGTQLNRFHAVSAIVEQPGNSASQRETYTRISEALSRAGISSIPVNGVPAEGLRRLGSVAAPKDYLEPVYLRGFL